MLYFFLLFFFILFLNSIQSTRVFFYNFPWKMKVWINFHVLNIYNARWRDVTTKQTFEKIHLQVFVPRITTTKKATHIVAKTCMWRILCDDASISKNNFLSVTGNWGKTSKLNHSPAHIRREAHIGHVKCKRKKLHNMKLLAFTTVAF